MAEVTRILKPDRKSLGEAIVHEREDIFLYVLSSYYQVLGRYDVRT